MTKVGFCAECGILRQDTDGVPDFECACLAKQSGHTAECAYYRAVASKIGIACEAHGEDVCMECDACTCGAGEHLYYRLEGKILCTRINEENE